MCVSVLVADDTFSLRQGIIPQSYVVEIAILPWADRDKALHPYYLTESGKCYVRRQASIVPVSGVAEVEVWPGRERPMAVEIDILR